MVSTGEITEKVSRVGVVEIVSSNPGLVIFFKTFVWLDLGGTV